MESINQHHVHGEAIIVSASTQTEVFKIVLPLLRVAKKHSSVLVGPLPRYLYTVCCRYSEHVTNLRKDDYISRMRADCDSARQKLKDSAWFNGLEQTKAINPGRTLRELCDKNGTDKRLIWGEDPVHPSPDGYRTIAEDIVRAASSVTAPGDRRKRVAETAAHIEKKRPRGDRGGSRSTFPGALARDTEPNPNYKQ